MKLERMFSRQWWKTSLLVLVAVLVMVRLGIWQLDRLEQRKAFNARVEAQLEEPPLLISAENLLLDLYNMEYREASVWGEYDHEQQVVLRNQDWQGRLGVHLLTPLIIQGSQEALLVDRGWIPQEDYDAGKLDQYDQPGLVEVKGTIRRSQVKPVIGGRADQVPGPGEPPLRAWYWTNIDSISGQMPYHLLPVYLKGSPEGELGKLPFRKLQEVELSEGSHLGYAFQWFTFAAILAFGYPIYIRKEEARKAGPIKIRSPYIHSKGSTHSTQDEGSKGFEKA